jgi:hypothetical protein
MRAKLVEYNFERAGDPKDQMRIGLGPSKYIEEFEKILDEFHWEYQKDDSWESNGVIEWFLSDDEFRGFGNEEIIVLDKNGWRFLPYSNDYFKDPFEIADYLIQSVKGSLKDELSEISMRTMQLESRISEIDKTSKKLNLNI